jgi:hypothetical protein
LTVVLALAGVFCIGAVLSSDPCDRQDDAGVFFMLVGLVLTGGAVFGVARGLTRRAWIAWTSAAMVPVAIGAVVYVVLLFRWVERCSN